MVMTGAADQSGARPGRQWSLAALTLSVIHECVSDAFVPVDLVRAAGLAQRLLHCQVSTASQLSRGERQEAARGEDDIRVTGGSA